MKLGGTHRQEDCFSKPNAITGLLHIVFGVAICVFAPFPANAQDDPGFNAQGFQQSRTYISELPFEHIDPFSGNVILTFTDLSLPGNAGFDLTWIRVHNSKIGGGWTFGVPGVPMKILEADDRQITDPNYTQPYPTLVTADGALHQTYAPVAPDNAPGTFVSTDFWRYDRTRRLLQMPNGWHARYNVIDTTGETQFFPFGNNVRYVTSLVDAYGNSLSFTYEGASPPRLTSITQALQNGQSRVLTIGYTGQLLTSVSLGSRTWTYAYVNNQLMEVTQPAGPPWHYEYASGDPSDLAGVTTPQGGTVTYQIVDYAFPLQQQPGATINSRVLHSRTVGGRGVQPGSWIYTYDTLNGEERTTIQQPQGTVVYTFHSGPPSFGQPHTIVMLDGATQLHSETLTWQAGPTVGIDQSAVNAAQPQLASRSITRDGQTFLTTYSYHTTDYADYGHPYHIVEQQGASTRVTDLTYRHTFGVYLKALVTQETVTIGSESFTTSAIYDSNGFKTSETKYGITTTFARDGAGNVSQSTDGNGHQTTYAYSWGTISGIWRPATAISRSINSDGTVATETRGWRTTTFGYDALRRITNTTPPGANATTMVYNDSAGIVTTSRGPSGTVTTVDGFGRVIQATNSAGVTTRSEYDAEGRKTYESYPYTATDVGTRIDYDALGRVVKRTTSDGKFVLITYGAGTVLIQDEERRGTTQTWQGFGDPDDRRLIAVNDAALRTWSYTYNAIGQLTGVSGPPGPNGEAIHRSWHYAPGKALLDSETHPESGTTTYGYDAAGNLTSKRDANGTGFTFTYDGNNRLTGVLAGSRQTTITYEPGSDNRQTLSNPSVSTTFVYDPAGRLQHRADTIGAEARRIGVAFMYDGNDNLVGTTYTSGRHVRQTFDAENHLLQVIDDTTGLQYAGSFGYHPSGAVTSFQTGNGIAHSMTYNRNRYWIESIDAGELHLSYANYDGVGNVRFIGDSRAGMAQSFGYDVLDRLTSAAGPYGSITMTYDAHGNRVDAGYQYQTGTMRLTTQNGAAFTYDTNGNLKTAPGTTYAYTPDNLLDSATLPGGIAASYAYDGDTWRTKKVVGSDVSYFSRDGGGQVLTDWTNPTGASPLIKDYVYAGGRLIAEAERSLPLGSVPPQPPLPGQPPVPAYPGAIETPPTLPDDHDPEPPPSGTCTDPTAQNYGGPLPCIPAEPPSGPDAVFYENARNNGLAMSASSDVAYVGDSWNDRVSSVHVPANTMVILYEHRDYQGARLVLTHDAVDLLYYPGPGVDGSWNDVVSSIQILPVGSSLPRVQGGNVLAPQDHALLGNWSVSSPNGDYTLIYQASDGNLVLYDFSGLAIWANGLDTNAGYAQMQGDGNFVVHDASGAVRWATGTNGHSGGYLVVQNDGNVVVYDVTGVPLWEAFPINILAPDDRLYPGGIRYSADGQYTLIYQFDGNLVEYRQDGSYVLDAMTTGPGFAVMQAVDGNFVIYNGNNVPVFDSRTASPSHAGAYFKVESDGFLSVISADGLQIYWQFQPQ